jgi:predicted ribosome quality control (RQC) complex YloA/Tae2 family protein
VVAFGLVLLYYTAEFRPLSSNIAHFVIFMLSHYYTLQHMAALLSRTVEGATIAGIYSQDRNQLCVFCEGENSETIIISCEPSFNYIYSRRGASRAKKNSIDIFPSLTGSPIRHIACNENDRIIHFFLDDGMRMDIALFGPKANVFLFRNETLEDAFLRKRELLAGEERPLYKLAAGDTARIQDAQAFITRFRALVSGLTIQRALRSLLPHLGITLTAEVLHRCGLTASASAELMIDRDIEKMFETVKKITILAQPSPETLHPVIYYDGENNPVSFSLIPLQSCEQYRLETYADVNEGIQRFVSRKLRSASFLKGQESLLSRLQKEEKKLEHALAKIETDLQESSRADEYERLGKILMAHLPVLSKGMKSFTYENEVIALDPAMSPVQNAERYFGRAKKSKTARDEQRERLVDMQRQHAQVVSLLDEAAELQTSEMIAQFQSSREKELSQFGIAATGAGKELPPFRIFTVDGGFQVLAGKSSENNDLLTLKHAKPDDLWFHARGSSGSHVVLKMRSAKGQPSKKAIQQAASIAAYYSKMKKASMIPVAMTEKKYVRKPKGVPAGTVVIEREKVLFVEAELPSDT